MLRFTLFTLFTFMNCVLAVVTYRSTSGVCTDSICTRSKDCTQARRLVLQAIEKSTEIGAGTVEVSCGIDPNGFAIVELNIHDDTYSSVCGWDNNVGPYNNVNYLSFWRNWDRHGFFPYAGAKRILFEAGAASGFPAFCIDHSTAQFIHGFEDTQGGRQKPFFRH